MVQKRFFMGILALTLIFGFTLSSCDDSSDGDDSGGVTVPAWAQGTWYMYSDFREGSQFCEITPSKLTRLYNNVSNPNAVNVNLKSVEGDTIIFENNGYSDTVKKGVVDKTIMIIGTTTITLYKK